MSRITAADIIALAESMGAKLSVHGGKLKVAAPKGLPEGVWASLRERKAEILAELKRRRTALACLMELPDGRRFWLAPDGMRFDAGGLPIIRRSIMDKLIASGTDLKTELRRLIDFAAELGGDLRMLPQNEGARPLPESQKRDSGEMTAPDSKEARP